MNSAENYFELFELPVSFKVNKADLEHVYERLCMENHPDFFATASQPEQENSQQITAKVNEGYRVLNSDSLRADHLLELLADHRELDNAQLPPGFLQEMFLLQEEIEDFDKTADADTISRLIKKTEERRCQLVLERGDLFLRAEEKGHPEIFQEIRSNLNCEKYFNRLLESLASEGN